MKKIISVFTSVVLYALMFVSTEEMQRSWESAEALVTTSYTIEELNNLQNFLLAKETPNLSVKGYDLDDNGIWNVFDLCLMKQQYLKKYSSESDTFVIYFSCTNNTEEVADPIESIDGYEIIYLGYPIWWGEEPRIIDTFLESYNFSDKIVIPFCTSTSSGISASEKNIRNLVTISNQLEGKRFASNATKKSVGD